MPDNGFDGFGSSMCLLSLAYMLPLAFAILVNSRGPARRHLPKDEVSEGLEPLQI